MIIYIYISPITYIYNIYLKMALSYKLTHPWFIYPGYPVKGYNKFDKYKRESLRLYYDINNYEPKQNTLFHIVIGAAMEEYYNVSKHHHDTSDLDFQWRQLFPYWLEHHLNNYPTNPINIIIISPNDDFDVDSKNFNVPRLIENTNNIYKWKHTDKTQWTSSICNLTVDIYNTMMIHYDKEWLSKYSGYMKKQKLIKEILFDIEEIHVSQEDKQFVDDFYDSFKTFITNVICNNGVVTCNSFAVFNISTFNRSISNYKMFSEIIDIFNAFSKNKVMLSEWLWTPPMKMYVVHDNIHDKNISYIKPECGMDDCEIPIIDSDYNISFQDSIDRLCYNLDGEIIKIDFHKYTIPVAIKQRKYENLFKLYDEKHKELFEKSLHTFHKNSDLIKHMNKYLKHYTNDTYEIIYRFVNYIAESYELNTIEKHKLCTSYNFDVHNLCF